MPIVGILSVIPYTGALYGDFVRDDVYLIRDNTHLDNPDYLETIWLKDFFSLSDGLRSYYWRPLVQLSMWIDYKIFGRDPFGFHLTNLILFGLMVSLMVLFFLDAFHLLIPSCINDPGNHSLPGDPSIRISAGAAFAALLFAWHPLRAETVCWISGRTDIMLLLFGIGSLIAFGRSIPFNGRSRSSLLFLSVILLSMALLSKESAILFPVFALIIYNRPMRRHCISSAWYGLPVLLWAISRHFAIGYKHWFIRTTDPVFIPVGAGRAFFHYVYLHLWPVGLSSEPWFPLPQTYFDGRALTGLALAALLFIAFFMRRTIITSGALWMLIGLAPFLHILPLAERAADRYTVLASPGFSMVLIGVVMMPRKWLLRVIGFVLLGILAAGWGIGANHLSATWLTDQDIMLRSALFGQSPQALFYLGDKAFTERDYKSAAASYAQALERADTPSVVAYYHLALAEIELTRLDDATRHLRLALELEPDHRLAGLLLGELLMRRGLFDESLRVMESQAARHPDNPVPHMVMGTIYTDFLGQPEKARHSFNEALKRDTQNIHEAFIRHELNKLSSR